MNRRGVTWSLRLILLGAIGALLWNAFPRERLLLTRATRIMQLDTYCYQWRSNTALLYARWQPRNMLIQRDVRSGVETRLFSADNPAYWKDGFVASPNGKWLIAHPFDDVRKSGTVAIDGNRLECREPPPGQSADNPGSNPIWLRDNRHWVIIRRHPKGNEYYVVLDNTDASGKPRITSLGSPHIDLGWVPRLLGQVGKDRVLCISDASLHHIILGLMDPTNDGDEKGPDVWFAEFGVGKKAANLREYAIHLHTNEIYVDDIALSPDGRRLAWVIHIKQPNPSYVRFLGRWLSFLRNEPKEIIELRTSRLDGSGIQVIGHIPLESHFYGILLYDLRWLPDGKRLSFTYDRALWTVPAD